MPDGTHTDSANAQNGAANPWWDKPIHDERPLKIICAGAGASGLLFAYKLQRSFENFELILYEKNEDIGGTWLENKYPGCACDIAAHAYVWSFEPNPDWSTVYAGSDEIHGYFTRFTEKYGLRKYCQFKKLISRAEWDNEKGQWNVEVTDTETGVTTQDWSHFIINATGFLSAWKWPNIPGINKFEGPILHSAKYDRSLDLTDKTVALIGTGSSAIQILPSIIPKVKRVVSFNRNATWVLPTQSFQQRHYTPEEKAAFAADPKKLEAHRRELDSDINALFSIFIKDSPEQAAITSIMRQAMAEKLQSTALENEVIPKWGLGCRRMTPGVGYLEALAHEKTEVVTSGVKEITAKGCVSDEGKEYAVDVVICATGFDTSYIPRFTIIGLDGRSMAEAWKDEPKSYFGFAAPGFPNYFVFAGPNSPVGNGPVLIGLEAQADYMLKMITRYQTEGILGMSPKVEAVEDFIAHKDAFMKRTIWEQECRSWYKNGSRTGKVTALWPGSTLHYLEAMREPRYEDWNFSYIGGNRFGYLGNGFSQTEIDRTADWSYYLRAVDDSPFLGRAKQGRVITRSGTMQRAEPGGKGAALF